MKPRLPPLRAAWLLVLALLALLPLALLWPALRHGIESRMSLHMLGEFPLLFAAGWSAGRLCLRRVQSRRWLRRQRRLDWHGWTSATLASGVALVWMLPSALDAALLVPGVAAAKLASWWLAGWLLADGWRRLDAEVALFFVGNLAWMLATAGLLFVDAPERLCVNYLQDDQRRAGIGLVLWALALGAFAVRAALGVARAHRPSVSSAASDIIERSQGGSNTMFTVASPTCGSASTLLQTSSAMASPMPQPGAVRVISISTRNCPSSSGDTSHA